MGVLAGQTPLLLLGVTSEIETSFSRKTLLHWILCHPAEASLVLRGWPLSAESPLGSLTEDQSCPLG